MQQIMPIMEQYQLIQTTQIYAIVRSDYFRAIKMKKFAETRMQNETRILRVIFRIFQWSVQL